MASKSDPTVKSGNVGPEYPEGTHPARPASEVFHSADRLEYKDAPADLKPDASSIVQVEVTPDDKK